MLKPLLAVAYIIAGILLGKAAFLLLEKNAVSVSYAAETIDRSNIQTSEYGLEWEPNFGSGALALRRTFSVEDHEIFLYITTYLSSEPDSELIRYGRGLVDPLQWRRDAVATSSLSPNRDPDVRYNIEVIEENDGQTRLAALYWYDVGGVATPSRWLAKLLSIANLFKLREDSTVIVFATECEIVCRSTIDDMKRLADDIFLDSDANYVSIIRPTKFD